MQAKNKDPVADALGALFRGLGSMLKNAFYGIRKLNRPLNIGGLLFFALVAFLSHRGREAVLALEQIGSLSLPVPVRYLLYWLLLCAPLLYLVALGSAGSAKAGKYDEIFEGIQFMGKDKRYPKLMREYDEGKTTIFLFYSAIPLSKWRQAREELETAFDCSIRKLELSTNKKTVQMVTVPSTFQLPKLIRWDDEYISDEDGVFVVGESDLDRISFNVNQTPHVLVAGETGSGKSVILRCLLWQAINKNCKVLMIDFKGGVEFGREYEAFGEVIMERKAAVKVLTMLVMENEARMKLFRSHDVKNLPEYNRKTHSNLCRICIFSDELAEMLDKSGASREDKELMEQIAGQLSTIARLGRAQGINLFLGVQRPDANVINGQIKNNIPLRISGRFSDESVSRIVLGNAAASYLPEIKGRFLYKVGTDAVEFQSYLFQDEEDLKDIDYQPGETLLGMRRPSTASAPAVEKRPPQRPQEPSADPEPQDDGFDFDFNFEEEYDE